MRRLVAIALLAATAVAAVLVAGGCAATGGGGRYKVAAIFDNAAFLIPGQDVRIAGANVGSVTRVSVTPARQARIEMEVDEKFAPFHTDADCFIAPQSLIGERFIQCSPGTPRARELRAEGDSVPTVPISRTHSPVDPDLVTATFRLPVRERLSIILNELGAGLAGNGPALSSAIRRANPALQATRDVLDKVDRDREILGRLIDRSDEVVAQLGQRRDAVARFIQEASDVSQTAAERDRAISEGIARLPGTLDETRASLGALRTLARRSRPLLGDLDQAARPLDRLVGDVPALSKASRPALRHLAAMSRTGTTTLRQGAPVVKRLRAFAKLGVPAGRLVTELNESLRERGVVEGIQFFVYNVALSISRYDKSSHILPSYLVSAATCATFSETTKPECDAHLTPGSATTRAARRQRATPRHHKRTRSTRRADAPAQESPSRPQRTPQVRKPDLGPAGKIVDQAGDVVEGLTKKPPPTVPPLPKAPAPTVPNPPSLPSGKQDDDKNLLDYLLGS